MPTAIRINTERYLLFSPDIHVGMAVAINRPIGRELAQQAARLCVARHPLLTSVIQFRKSNEAYYALGACPPFVPEFLETDAAPDLRNIITELNETPFDLEHGPLLRLRVLCHAAGTDIIALGHHMLGDGLSFLYFMRDFLLALDGKPLPGPLVPPIIQDESHFSKRARLGLLAKLFAISCSRQYQKNGRRYTVADYHKIYGQLRELRKPDMAFFELSEEQTSVIIKNCKAHNMTVNDGISAAFWAARHWAGGLSRFLGISNNVRTELTPNPGESMGNYVSGIAMDLPYNNTLDFWGNAKLLKQQIDGRLKVPQIRTTAIAFLNELSDDLQDAINFYPFEAQPHPVFKRLGPKLAGETFKGLGISNLGRHAFAFDTFDVSNMAFIPPLFGTADLIVGVVTVNGAMTLCVRFGAAEITKEKVLAVTEKAVQVLAG